MEDASTKHTHFMHRLTSLPPPPPDTRKSAAESLPVVSWYHIASPEFPDDGMQMVVEPSPPGSQHNWTCASWCPLHGASLATYVPLISGSPADLSTQLSNGEIVSFIDRSTLELGKPLRVVEQCIGLVAYLKAYAWFDAVVEIVATADREGD